MSYLILLGPSAIQQQKEDRAQMAKQSQKGIRSHLCPSSTIRVSYSRLRRVLISEPTIS